MGRKVLGKKTEELEECHLKNYNLKSQSEDYFVETLPPSQLFLSISKNKFSIKKTF